MWQIEDVIRASGFDIEKLKESYINRFTFNDENERRTVIEWYDSLIEMMISEQIKEKGHLQINKNVMYDLLEFHSLILKSNSNPAYNAKFIHILPLINQFRIKSEVNLSDIELCFNFQYGILMLKLKKEEISSETLKTQEEIAKFMVLLAKDYHLYKTGELDLE
ncbi:DUF4924 family protein [Paludibacter sp.]